MSVCLSLYFHGTQWVPFWQGKNDRGRRDDGARGKRKKNGGPSGPRRAFFLCGRQPAARRATSFRVLRAKERAIRLPCPLLLVLRVKTHRRAFGSKCGGGSGGGSVLALLPLTALPCFFQKIRWINSQPFTGRVFAGRSARSARRVGAFCISLGRYLSTGSGQE